VATTHPRPHCSPFCVWGAMTGSSELEGVGLAARSAAKLAATALYSALQHTHGTGRTWQDEETVITPSGCQTGQH